VDVGGSERVGGSVGGGTAPGDEVGGWGEGGLVG